MQVQWITRCDSAASRNLSDLPRKQARMNFQSGYRSTPAANPIASKTGFGTNAKKATHQKPYVTIQWFALSNSFPWAIRSRPLAPMT